MRVVNKKDKVEGALFIGRPSKWGNPYKIGEHGTREEVIKLYEKHVFTHAELYYSLPELQGYEALECFCAPLPCHGDVLARLAETHVTGGVCHQLRITITGSRKGVSYDRVAAVLERWRGHGNHWILGGALGVDHHALRWCQENDEEYWVYHPSGHNGSHPPVGPDEENRRLLNQAFFKARLHLLAYEDYPKAAAYHRRNGVMLEGADLCLAFPSPSAYRDFRALLEAGAFEDIKAPIVGHGGTINAISQAKIRDIPIKVTGRR